MLCISVVLVTACSKISVDESELKIGVVGIQGNFSPFYAESEADKKIMAQIYQPIQRRISDNSLVNNCGGISYEYVGNTQVKYTVTIRDDLTFSDGTKVTIDDVIFFYHFIADATYDGVYSDWHLNDIVGLKEYYFDNKNYVNDITAIELNIASNYTASTISVNDYVDYLVATELEGAFNESTAPSGKAWSEYFGVWGYSSEFAALGSSPEKSALLKLAAKSEAENNPLSYSPESWYRERLYAEYTAANYSDGIDVSSISGIQKIDDYSCSILFNSRNTNAVSQINAYIVSEDYYSVEYIKGSAEKAKEISASSVGSGAYKLSDFKNGEATLTHNKFNSENLGFSSLKFIDYSDLEKTLAQAFVNGEIDIAETVASASVISSLNNETSKYFISNSDYYVSLFANSLTLDYSQRKSLLGLCDVNDYLSAQLGSYYTALYMPLSVRFPEYPTAVTEPYYTRSAFTAHKLANGAPLNSIDLYFAGSETDFEYGVLNAYKNLLAKDEIVLNIHLTDEVGLKNAVKNGSADLWLEIIQDGATCDKYDYFNSSGQKNKSFLASEEIDALTETVRSSVGFADKTALTYELLKLVMEEAVEFPVYQLQTVTLYNIEKISPDSFDDDFNYDGYDYAIPHLKSV